ncbi:hypothetical protein AB0T83_16340 [Fluviibacterium sp. DFM31]|uniref:Uncharacterized protein n=1 Tax=Meridianimarinicoccus marinus TaxID=3231483 RepID=A0ABV3LBD3_9RHOB
MGAQQFDPANMPPAFTPTEANAALRPWLVQNMKRSWADIDYSEFTPGWTPTRRSDTVALPDLYPTFLGAAGIAPRA